MAKQRSNAGTQSNSPDVGQEESARTPVEATLAQEAAESPLAQEAAESPLAQSPVVEAPVESISAQVPSQEIALREPVAAMVEAAAALPAKVEQLVESTTEALTASFHIDTGLWSKKSIELWAENATAFFELAEQLAKAQTFEDVVDLQSRFAKARFEALLRQSKEMMDFARNMTSLSAAPLCDARKAA
jgi:hypothetical protein